MREFTLIWSQIQESSTLRGKFNEENIIISGLNLRRVMKQSAKFGIENYQRLQQQCVKNWNYHNAFFFAGTLATTNWLCPYVFTAERRSDVGTTRIVNTLEPTQANMH